MTKIVRLWQPDHDGRTASVIILYYGVGDFFAGILSQGEVDMTAVNSRHLKIVMPGNVKTVRVLHMNKCLNEQDSGRDVMLGAIS